MALALADIQERIEDAVAADGDWLRSAHTWHEFPPPLDTGDSMHRAFAVGLLSTEAVQEDRQIRGNRHVGAWAITQVSLRFTYDLRADDKRGSYREALADEQALVALVLATVRDPELQLRYEGTVVRDQVAPAVLMVEVHFQAHHHYALQA